MKTKLNILVCITGILLLVNLPVLAASINPKTSDEIVVSKVEYGEGEYNAPISLPKQIIDAGLAIKVCHAELGNVTAETYISFSYTVKDKLTGTVVREFSNPVVGIRPKHKSVLIEWNPLSFPERMNLGHEDYTISVEIKHEGKVLLQHTYNVKIKGLRKSFEMLEKYNSPISAEYVNEMINEGKFYGVEYFTTHLTGLTADKLGLLGRKLTGANVVDLRISWSTLEPTKDKYNWDIVDRMVKNAEELGTPLIISVVWWEGAFPGWLMKDSVCMKPNVEIESPFNEASWGYGLHMGSYASEEFRQAFFSMMERVMNRYMNRRIIAGWNFSPMDNDAVYRDTAYWQIAQKRVRTPYIFDYSDNARRAFQTYLKNKYKNIKSLNAIYGNQYQDFSEIELPLPDWNQKIDRRPIWWDFQNFKVWIATDFRYEQFRKMRKLDNRRWIYGFGLYQGILDEYVKPFKKFGVIFDASIYGPIEQNIYGYIVRRAGAKCFSEDYGFHPYVTHKLWGAELLQNIETGSMGHLGMRAWYGTGIYTGDFEKWKPIFFNLIGSKPVTYSIGALGSYSLALEREKTFQDSYYFRGNINLETGAALQRWLEYSGYSHDWFSDFSDLKNLPYSLIIDANSEVLPKNVMKRLKKYVSDGGQLVIFADSGKYLPTTAGPGKFVLLKTLGFEGNIYETHKDKSIISAENNWSDLVGLRIFDALLLSNLQANYKVLAKFNDNAPALIEWQLGKGKVLFAAGVVDYGKADGEKFLEKVGNWAALEKDANIQTEGTFRNALMKKDNSYYWLCYYDTNPTWEGFGLLADYFKSIKNVDVKINIPEDRYFSITDEFTKEVLSSKISAKELREKGFSLGLTPPNRLKILRISAVK